MFKRRFKSSCLVPSLLIGLLLLFGGTLLTADSMLQPAADYPAGYYKEDINKDGWTNIADVIALLILGMKDPANPIADYNGDGSYSTADAISLLGNVVKGNLTPLQHFSILGRVVLGGQGLEGVQVSVTSEHIDTVVTTEPTGTFCLGGLLNETCTVTPLKADYLFAPGSVEVCTNGDSVSVPDIEAMLAVYTVSGRVLLGDAGLAGVAVRFEGGPAISGYELMIKKKTRTDSLGAFRFTGLPSGFYELWCKQSLYDYTFTPDPMEVMISGESVSDVNVMAKLAGYTIRGRVLEAGAGLPGVSVSITGVGMDTVIVTDPTGKYSVDGVKDANYVVTPEKENYKFNPPSTTARVWGDSVAVADIKATYTEPETSPVLYTIGGRVSCAIQAQINVIVILTGDLEASTITDANGFYVFTVPNGEYKIIGIPNPDFQQFNPPYLNVRVQGYDILNLDMFAFGTQSP